MFLLRCCEEFVEVYLVGVGIAPDKGWRCKDYQFDDSHNIDPLARCDSNLVFGFVIFHIFLEFFHFRL